MLSGSLRDKSEFLAITRKIKAQGIYPRRRNRLPCTFDLPGRGIEGQRPQPCLFVRVVKASLLPSGESARSHPGPAR